MRAEPLFELAAIQGTHAGHAFRLGAEPVLIGRLPECQILCPEDLLVSRKHVALTVRDGECFCTDLGSTNGTEVNGERVTGEVPLPASGILQLGAQVFVLNRTHPAVAPPADPVQEELPAAQPAAPVRTFDDGLLQRFMTGFYGYGNYSGPYWLIGMEEGGGKTTAEIQRRLDAWRRHGCPEVDDVLAFHREIGEDQWFRPNPPLQQTWNKLIRLLLKVQGSTADTDAVRAYQGGRLGRAGSENCILELLPLPSPGKDRWLYEGHSGIPYLCDRPAYEREIAPKRVQHLRRRLMEHRPRLVVFYGLGDRARWEQIAGGTFGSTLGRLLPRAPGRDPPCDDEAPGRHRRLE